MRRQFPSMSQQAGLPGSHPVTMPNRQASASSNLSDDAVPTMDPKDVSSCSSHTVKIHANTRIRPPNCLQSVCKLGNTRLAISKTM